MGKRFFYLVWKFFGEKSTTNNDFLTGLFSHKVRDVRRISSWQSIPESEREGRKNFPKGNGGERFLSKIEDIQVSNPHLSFWWIFFEKG
jgi:hypothetical protein